MGGSSLLVSWSGNASAVVLAFSGTNETLENVATSNPLQSSEFMEAAFGDNGTVDPLSFDPFQEVMTPNRLFSVSFLVNLKLVALHRPHAITVKR